MSLFVSRRRTESGNTAPHIPNYSIKCGERSALCPGHFLPLGKSIIFIKTFLVNIMIFWEVMPCALVYSYQQFRKQETVKLQQHSVTCLPDSTALHPSINVNVYEDLNCHVIYLNISFFHRILVLCVFGNHFWSS